jgi:hypothetical protein
MTRPTTQAISPFFIVSNVDQTIAFYRDKLGFETRFQDRIETLFSPSSAATGRRSSSNPTKTRRRCRTPSVIAPCGGTLSSMHQTRMLSPSNLPIMVQHSACRSRIPTMVCAGSRFATLTAMSCFSVDPGKWRGEQPTLEFWWQHFALGKANASESRDRSRRSCPPKTPNSPRSFIPISDSRSIGATTRLQSSRSEPFGSCSKPSTSLSMREIS